MCTWFEPSDVMLPGISKGRTMGEQGEECEWWRNRLKGENFLMKCHIATSSISQIVNLMPFDHRNIQQICNFEHAEQTYYDASFQ